MTLYFLKSLFLVLPSVGVSHVCKEWPFLNCFGTRVGDAITGSVLRPDWASDRRAS